MAVLYRKYRPQIFAEVVNQKYIIQTLKNQVELGQVSHAYLFTGSRGVGKTTVARIMAKAINCLNKNQGEACGKCEVCKQVEHGNFIDLIEIDAASNTGVDNIRELIEHIKFTPSIGKFKVFIIDEVHMLSKGAFNALLKTLEEPPVHAIFILATTEVGKVPATIISRTQRYDFKALSEADIKKHLEKILDVEKIKISSEIVELIALNADGSVRDALSLLDKILTLGAEATLEESQKLLGITDLAVCENLTSLIVEGKINEIPDFFDQLLEKGQDFQVLNRDFLEYLRKILICKITDGQAVHILTAERKQKAVDFSHKFTLIELIFIIRLFLRSFKELGNSPIAQIPLLLASLEAALKNGQNPKLENTKIQSPSFVSKNIKDHPQSAEIKKSPELAKLEEKENLDKTSSLQEIQLVWSKIIEQTKEKNFPLANLIKNAALLDVNNGKVVLGVKFSIHKQNIENQKNSQIFLQAISEVLGKRVGMEICVLKDQSENLKKLAPTEALTDALKIFGGEIIE